MSEATAVKQLQSLCVGRINNGNTGGTKLVDIDTTSMADGTIASVFSVGALFRLVKSPTAQLTAAVDGITVVQSVASPSSIWVRLITTTDERFVVNIPVFIDPGLGSDDNDGLTLGTALQSADEWCRRMDGQVFKDGSIGTVTVTCGAGDIGHFKSCRLIATQTLGSINIKFLGTTQQSVEIGTISSFVAQNIATNTEYQFTDSSGVGPTISAGSRLRIVGSVTPAHIGGTGYARGFAGGGATNPYTTAFVQNDGSDTEFFPAVGDTYVVETLLTQIETVTIRSEVDSYGRFLPVWEDVLVGNLVSSLPGVLCTTTDSESNFGYPKLLACSLQGNTLIRLDGANVKFSGCEFLTTVGTPAGLSGTLAFNTCIWRNGFNVISQISTFAGSNVIEGSVGGTSGAASNSGNILLSRIMSGPGFNVSGALATYASAIGVIWTPPIGARNGLSIGVQAASFGRFSVQSFANAFNVLATNPFVVSGTVVSGFFLDILQQSGILGNASNLGGLTLLQNSTYAPSRNPSSSFYRWCASGSDVVRGSGGSITTTAPAGGAASGHANFTGVKYSAGPTNTVNAATATIVTSPSLAAFDVVLATALDNAGVLVKGTLLGKDGSNNVISVEVARTVKRIAGVLTATGASTTTTLGPIGDAALTGVAGIIDVSGNTIILQATGVGGATIAWNGTMTLTSTDFAG